MTRKKTKSAPPKSSTPIWPPFIGIALYFFIYINGWPKHWQNEFQALLAIGLYALPCLLWEFINHTLATRSTTRKATKLDDVLRVLIKQIGLMTTFGIIVFGYWLLPVYNDKFYSPYFMVLIQAAAGVLLITPFYLWWVDRRQAQPKDGLYQWGAVIIFQFKDVDWKEIANYWRGWLVKAYFLPMMFVFLLGHFNGFISLPGDKATLFNWFYWCISLLFMIDVIGGCAGYMLALKATDTHIRTAEPTMFGWVVAIVCYNPFWGVVGNNYFAYDNGHKWSKWLADAPMTIIAPWAGVCLLLLLTYTLATMAFGVRFSNLTYRGLISHGPYRLTKHPAYFCKNLFWWLTAVPFVATAGGWVAAVQASIMLLMVNGLYYLRAKTEERHLRRYPEYQEYYDWMNENALIDKRLKRVTGFVKTKLHLSKA